MDGEGSINLTQMSLKFANGQKYESADMGERGVKKSKNVQTTFMDGPILFKNCPVFVVWPETLTVPLNLLTKPTTVYRTCAIISRGLYIFTPFFSAVYNRKRLILQTIYVQNKEM